MLTSQANPPNCSWQRDACEFQIQFEFSNHDAALFGFVPSTTVIGAAAAAAAKTNWQITEGNNDAAVNAWIRASSYSASSSACTFIEYQFGLPARESAIKNLLNFHIITKAINHWHYLGAFYKEREGARDWAKLTAICSLLCWCHCSDTDTELQIQIQLQMTVS